MAMRSMTVEQLEKEMAVAKKSFEATKEECDDYSEWFKKLSASLNRQCGEKLHLMEIMR